MLLRLLTLVLCCVFGVNAVIGQRQNEVSSSPDFNNVFSSLFGFKTTFIGAKRNLVNKQLERVSGGFNDIGNMFGLSSSSADSQGSGHSSGGHDGGYNYEPPASAVQSSYGLPAPVYVAPTPAVFHGSGHSSGGHDGGYNYEPPVSAVQSSYGLPAPVYVATAPQASYGPPENSYLPAYGLPHQSVDGGYHYERPPAASSSSGFASSSSHISPFSDTKESSGLQDLTSIGGFGGHSKGTVNSKGQSSGLGGFGGFGNIFSSIGQFPKQAIGAKRNAVNSVFDGKISLLERFAQLSSRGSNSNLDSYSPASTFSSYSNSESHPYS